MAVIIGGAGLGQFDVHGQGSVGSASGLSVNAFTGNVVAGGADQRLISQGLDLSLARTYNSQGASGEAWRFSFERSVLAAGDVLERVTGDGHRSVFRLQADGSYVSTSGSGAHDVLTREGDNWVYTEGSTGLREVYRVGDGQLQYTEDSDGNRVTYGYENGVLTSLDSAGGETLRVVYDDAGRVSRLDTHMAGADGDLTHSHSKVYYGYDDAGRLSSVTVDLSPADKTIEDGHVFTTSYTYQDPTSSLLKTISQSNGSVVTLSYQDVEGQTRLSTINDNGQVTAFAWDNARTNGHQLAVTDASGAVRYYQHDAQGRLTSVLSPAVAYADSPGAEAAAVQGNITYTYDDADNLKTVTDASGSVVRNDYDDNGNLTEVYRNGALTLSHAYDSNNQRIHSTRYAADGSVESISHAVYDGRLLRFTVSATGSVTEYTYNSVGERVSTRVYIGAAFDTASTVDLSALTGWTASQNKQQSVLTDYTYARGDVATQTTYTRLDANGQGIVVSDVTVSTSAAASGRSVTVGHTPVVSDLGSGITLTVLNAQHQVVSSETIDTANVKFTGTVLAEHIEQWGAFPEGSKVVITTSAGWVTHLSDRAVGSLNSLGIDHAVLGKEWRENPDPEVLLVAVSEVKDGQWSLIDQSVRAADEALTLSVTGTEHVHMTYDAFGNLLGTQTLSGNLATGEVRVLSQTRQVVDGLNRVTSVTDAAGNTVSTQYLDASRQVLVTQESGLVTERTFSVRGELLTESQQATGETTRTRGFVYDARGQLVATTYPNGSVSVQQYDAAGRLWVSVSATGQVTEYRRNSEGRVIQEIRYDSALDMTEWLDIQSNTLSVTADDILSQVSEKTTHRIITTEYDARGRLHRVIDGEGRVAETQYGHQDRQVGVLSYTEGDKANAVSAPQTYDAAGRLESQVDADGYRTSYLYDAAGRLVETKSYQRANVAKTSGLVDRVQTFYDAKGRQQYTVNAQGFVTETRYLDAGREVATYRYEKPVTHRGGGITSILNKAGDAQLLSRVRHDDAGRLVSSINQHGIETRYHYDDVTGLLRQQTSAANTDDSRSVYHTYTGFNELKGQVSLAGKQEWQSLSLTDLVTQQGSQTTYNTMGWTDTATHPATGTTQYAYDNAGRLLSTTDAAGRTTSRTYNAFGDTETRTAGGELKEAFTYDNAGRLARTVDGEGITTAYHYNDQGHVSHTVRQHVSDAYQAFNTTGGGARGDLIARYVTQYGYDARGNVIAQSVAKDTREGSSLTGGDTLTDIAPSAKLKYVSQWTRKYDHAGRVTEEKNGAGVVSTTSYLYGGLQQVNKISDHVQTRITLDALGRTLTEKDGAGRTTTYAYDDQRRTIAMVTPSGIRTVTESNAHGETAIVTDGEGNERQFHYDHRGQVTHTAFKAAGSDTLEVLTTNSYDTRTGLLDFTVDSEGAKTEYRYTANGLQLQVIQHVDDITLITEYGYDSQNRRIWTLSEGRKTAFSYDSHNRQLQVTEENRWQETDTDGNVVQRQHDVATTYQYDANGQVLRSVEGQFIAFDKADERVLEERVTEYGYDAQGSMTHKVVKSGADWGQSLSQNLSENKSHRTTEYRYNGAGQVTEKITGNGATARTVYDKLGRVAYDINALNYVTAYAYDENNRVERTTRYITAIILPNTPLSVENITAALTPSAQDRITQTRYDDEGRVHYEIDGAGYAIGYTYNANGQVTQTTQYHLPTTDAGWSQASAANRTTHSLYDGKGQLRFTVSPNGQVSERRYDGEGRVTQTLRYGETVNLTAALTDTEALSEHLKTQLANETVRSEMTVYDVLGRKRFTLDGDGYLVEYQYNRHSEVATKKEYVNNTAIKNAIIEVRNGDSDVSDYALFQQALYDLSGIETASEELKAKLDELNAQQGRIDALSAELSALETEIESTDAENASLEIQINAAAVRLDALYLEIKEEAAYQDKLKEDIDALRGDIEEREAALSVQYTNELAAAKSALNAAEVAYGIALAKKGSTQDRVHTLLGDSRLTEYLASADLEDVWLSDLISQNQQDVLQGLKDILSVYLEDHQHTFDTALNGSLRIPTYFHPGIYNYNNYHADLLTLFDGEGSLVTGYSDQFTATLDTLLAQSVPSPSDFRENYRVQLSAYLEEVNTALSGGDNTSFGALLTEGQTLLKGMQALTDALLAMPEHILTPSEAEQRFDARHPDYDANLAALSEAKATYTAALDAEQNIKAEIEALKDSVNLSGVNATYFLNHSVYKTDEQHTAMRAIFPYMAMQYHTVFSGYNDYFRIKYYEQLDLVTDTSSHHENQLRLQDYLVQTEWTAEGIAESEALSRYWVNELEHIEAVLETLPDNFLTLEEATALRETNPGNTYTGTLTTYVAPSDVYTTEQALEATFVQVEKDANRKLGVVRSALSAMRSLSDAFERLEASKDMMLAAQAEIDRLEARIPEFTALEAYEKTVATTVDWSKQYLSKLLTSERVDAEFALIEHKLAHIKVQHLFDTSLAEKERTEAAVHTYAEPSVITKHLPYLTDYITLKNEHYGSTIWKATKTPQDAEKARVFLGQVKDRLNELLLDVPDGNTSNELQRALALADEIRDAIEVDELAGVKLDTARVALADAPALPKASESIQASVEAAAKEKAALEKIAASWFSHYEVLRPITAPSLHVRNDESNIAIRALFHYNSSQYGAYVSGYSSFFIEKLSDQLSGIVSLDAFQNSTERLKTISGLKDLDDEDVAEALNLVSSLLDDLGAVEEALKTLPENFLTFEEAEVLRASNVGNIALEEIAVSVASSENVTTDSAIEATLKQLQVDVADKLEGAKASAVELLSLQLQFQDLAASSGSKGVSTAVHGATVTRMADSGAAEAAVMLAEVRYQRAVEEREITEAIVRGYTSLHPVTEYLPQYDYQLEPGNYNNPLYHIYHATNSETLASAAINYLTSIKLELRDLRTGTDDIERKQGVTEAILFLDDILSSIADSQAARVREASSLQALSNAKALASDVAEYLEKSPEKSALAALSGLVSHLVSQQGVIKEASSDTGSAALATSLDEEGSFLWQATESEAKGKQALTLVEQVRKQLSGQVNTLDLRMAESQEAFEDLSAEKTRHLEGITLLSKLYDAIQEDIAAQVEVSHTETTKAQTQATQDDVNARYEHFIAQLTENAFGSLGEAPVITPLSVATEHVGPDTANVASSNDLTLSLRRVSVALHEQSGQIELQRRLLASDPGNTLAIEALAEMEAAYGQLEQEQTELLSQLGEETAAEHLQLTSSYTSLNDAKTRRAQAVDDITTNQSRVTELKREVQSLSDNIAQQFQELQRKRDAFNTRASEFESASNLVTARSEELATHARILEKHHGAVEQQREQLQRYLSEKDSLLDNISSYQAIEVDARSNINDILSSQEEVLTQLGEDKEALEGELEDINNNLLPTARELANTAKGKYLYQLRKFFPQEYISRSLSGSIPPYDRNSESSIRWYVERQREMDSYGAGRGHWYTKRLALHNMFETYQKKVQEVAKQYDSGYSSHSKYLSPYSSVLADVVEAERWPGEKNGRRTEALNGLYSVKDSLNAVIKASSKGGLYTEGEFIKIHGGTHTSRGVPSWKINQIHKAYLAAEKVAANVVRLQAQQSLDYVSDLIEKLEDFIEVQGEPGRLFQRKYELQLMLIPNVDQQIAKAEYLGIEAHYRIYYSNLKIEKAQENIRTANQALQALDDNIADAEVALNIARAERLEGEAAVARTRNLLAEAEVAKADKEKLLLAARSELNVAADNYLSAQSALYRATDSLNAAYDNLGVALDLHRQADMYIRQAQASAGEAKATLAEAQELVNLAQFSVLRKANADIASHDTGYVYDGRGQLIAEQSALVSFGEHAEGGMKQYIGRLITEHDYDSLGNVTRTITAANTNNANTTHYYYDVQGNQIRSIGLGSSSVIYNSQNLAAVNINALKERRDRVYDDEGRLRYEVDELGFVTEHRYDGLNQKTTQLRYANAYTAGRPEGAPLTLAALDAFISEGQGGDYRALDYRYSARGELETTTTSSSVDSQTRTNGVHHNAFGDKTSTFTTYVDGQGESQTVTNQHHLYNAAGQLMASRDAEGYVTMYAYNGYGELSSQRELSARYVDSNEDPLAWDWTSLDAWAGTREGAAHERRTEFAYDHRGHRHQVTQVDVEYAQHGGSTVEQIRGDLVTTSYHDHAGRMFMTVQEAAPSDAQTHLTAADRTLHEYDALGRLVASWTKRKDYVVSGIALSVDNTDPTPLNKHQRTDYTYDAQGNLIATESDGRATYQRYDADGKLTKRIDAQGNVTHVDVDAMNRTKAEWRNVSAPGYQYEQRTEYNYDATGRQMGTTVTVNTGQNITESAVYNAFGEVTAKTHNGVVQENYAYDGLGRVHTRTMLGSQEDVVTTYQYNWQDKVTTETLGGSRTTARQYDLTGNLVSETGPRFDGKQSETAQTFDRWGNVRQQTVNGKTYDFVYNHANQVILQTSPVENETIVDASGQRIENARPQTRMFYDRHGNRLAVQDANGHWQWSGYDLAGQKLWDKNGEHGVTRYYHNIHGEMVGRINADGKGEVFRYDNNGQLLTRSKIDNTKGHLQVYAKYAYDQAGQRYHEQWFGGAGYEIYTRYDSAGRVLETQGNGQHKRYTYDSFGNKQADILLYGGSERARKTSVYDAFGKLSTETLYDGSVVEHHYDKYGQLDDKAEAISINYHYYGNGLLAWQQTGSKRESYTYNADGKETRRTLQDGDTTLVTTTQWDNLGRIESISNETVSAFGQSLKASSVTYRYDEVGNRRKITTTGEQNSTRWYHYDKDNRMVGSHTRTNDVEFDSIGNRAGDRKIMYNTLGQKEVEHRWENKTREDVTALIHTKEVFEYDKHGHLFQVKAYEIEGGTEHQTRLMTQENSRMGQATSQTYITYKFDYVNGRISSQTGAKTTNTDFGYLDGRLISQDVKDGTQLAYTVHFDYHFSGQMHQQRTVYHKDDHGVDTLTYAYRGRESFQKNTITANSTREGNGSGFKAGTTTYAYNSAGQLSGITSTREESERKHLTDFNGQIALQLDVEKSTLLANLTTSGNPLATITKGKVDADLLDDSGASAGQQPGTYTVGANDTLQRISQLVYGDSRYWYLIADANGLSPTEPLTEGKLLVIPNQHTQTFNGAESFKPYNESEVLGNVNPDPIALPPPKKSCNPIAMIIMVVVAVVVTIYTAGAAATLFAGGSLLGGGVGAAGVGALGGVAAGGAVVTTAAGVTTSLGALGLAGAAAIGGAVGSAASQLVGKGLGVVDDFSWTQVALGGLTAAAASGIGGALGEYGVFNASPDAANLAWRQAGNASVSSATSYGGNYLGSKLLGEDVSFSWTNLAASAVGSAVSVGSAQLTKGLSIVGDTIDNFVSSATATALRGESFSRNAGRLLTDAFGNALATAATSGARDDYQEERLEVFEREKLRKSIEENSFRLLKTLNFEQKYKQPEGILLAYSQPPKKTNGVVPSPAEVQADALLYSAEQQKGMWDALQEMLTVDEEFAANYIATTSHIGYETGYGVFGGADAPLYPDGATVSQEMMDMLGGIGIVAMSAVAGKELGKLKIKVDGDYSYHSSDNLDSIDNVIANKFDIKKLWTDNALEHALIGEFDDLFRLKGGMHGQDGFNILIDGRASVGSQYNIESVTSFAPRNDGNSILVETLSNGVRRAQLPREAWASKKAFEKASIKLSDDTRIKGVKTLLPESFTVDDILNASYSILEKNVNNTTEKFLYGSYKGVELKLVRDLDTGMIKTLHPTWNQ